MTHEKWIGLTPYTRRIKIAELCGWTEIHDEVNGLKYKPEEEGPHDLRGCDPRLDKGYRDGSKVPYYGTDFNAIQDAISDIIDPHYVEEFGEKLVEVLIRDWTPERWHGFSDKGRWYAVATAKVGQLCEAFVLTMDDK